MKPNDNPRQGVESMTVYVYPVFESYFTDDGSEAKGPACTVIAGIEHFETKEKLESVLSK